MKKAIKEIKKTIKTEEIGDNVIEHIVNTTFNTLDTHYGKCIYCKNFRRYGIPAFSLCKIRHHLEPQCCYYDIDINKFVNKNYYDIHFDTYLHRENKCTQRELLINKKIRKRIMYLGTKIYDTIKNKEKYLGD